MRCSQTIPNAPDAAPYVEWFGIKADDKKEITMLLEQARRLQNVDKEQQEIADWITKFSELRKLAQESGETTTKHGVENIVNSETRITVGNGNLIRGSTVTQSSLGRIDEDKSH
jgi:hypothetical protein